MVMDTPIVCKLMLLLALYHASFAVALDFTIVRPSYRASIDPVSACRAAMLAEAAAWHLLNLLTGMRRPADRLHA